MHMVDWNRKLIFRTSSSMYSKTYILFKPSRYFFVLTTIYLVWYVPSLKKLQQCREQQKCKLSLLKFFTQAIFFVQLKIIYLSQNMYVLVYAHDYAEKMKGRLASFSPTLCSNPLEYIAMQPRIYTQTQNAAYSSLCSAAMVLCRIRYVVIHTTTAILD